MVDGSGLSPGGRAALPLVRPLRHLPHPDAGRTRAVYALIARRAAAPRSAILGELMRPSQLRGPSFRSTLFALALSMAGCQSAPAQKSEQKQPNAAASAPALPSAAPQANAQP